MITQRQVNGKSFAIPQLIVSALSEEYSTAELAVMSPKEMFEKYLEWEGIIGYTDRIWEAVVELKQIEQERKHGHVE
jgi:hypothetical protein